jgi:hypothetical protein
VKSKYEALKIPDRKVEQIGQGALPSRETAAEQPISSLSGGVFYEIEYDASPYPGVGKFVTKPNPQRIDMPKNDPIRELFKQMREIARAHRHSYAYSRFFDRRIQSDNATVFYKQALFMKDFTDEYEGNTPFSQYFPNYQMMGYEQLRTYFTWRTQVRQGNVADTSLSYAFLYIYELLHNIGTSDPQDGLDKLMFFWKAFREHNNSVDKYVLRWLKDYHIYYELSTSFWEFVDINGLMEHYPVHVEPDDNFELFCSISKYDIRKSKFFTDENREMLSDCFGFVLDKIRRDFGAAGMNFDDVLFRPTRKLVPWKPFKDALFYKHLKQPERRVVFSENEIYICRQIPTLDRKSFVNEWIFSTIITTEKGKRFIGYVMKQMESYLRRLSKYRFKLTANTDMIHEDTIRILTKAGLFIEKIVPAAVLEYHKEATKTVVTVDHASLARIREEALQTQESLVVDEILQMKDGGPVGKQFLTQDRNIFADTAVDVGDEPPLVVEDYGGLSTEDGFNVWEGLKAALTETELGAIAVVLRGENIKIFADECGIMLEVLIDGINEKAMDYMGDNILDDDFMLYDDYIYQVKELIE